MGERPTKGLPCGPIPHVVVTAAGSVVDVIAGGTVLATGDSAIVSSNTAVSCNCWHWTAHLGDQGCTVGRCWLRLGLWQGSYGRAAVGSQLRVFAPVHQGVWIRTRVAPSRPLLVLEEVGVGASIGVPVWRWCAAGRCVRCLHTFAR